MTDAVVVLVTASDEEEAAAIAGVLVGERLAACVNIIRGIRSIYRWQGRIEDGPEALMVIKTSRELLDGLVAKVKESHSYTVPEVIALPVLGGSAEYLGWLQEETGRGPK